MEKLGLVKNMPVELAKISSKIIFEGEKNKLIDEWQEATNLWDEIRTDVDKSGQNGQYILTGSITSNRKGISHSGTGRFEKNHFRTISLFESGDSSGLISLKDICDGKKIPSVLCVICGMTNAAYIRPDGVYVIPITALKN